MVRLTEFIKVHRDTTNYGASSWVSCRHGWASWSREAGSPKRSSRRSGWTRTSSRSKVTAGRTSPVDRLEHYFYEKKRKFRALQFTENIKILEHRAMQLTEDITTMKHRTLQQKTSRLCSIEHHNQQKSFKLCSINKCWMSSTCWIGRVWCPTIRLKQWWH